MHATCHPMPTLSPGCMHAPRAADPAQTDKCTIMCAYKAQQARARDAGGLSAAIREPRINRTKRSRTQQARAQNTVLPATVLLMKRGGGHVPHGKPAGCQQRLKASLAPPCTAESSSGIQGPQRPGPRCQQHPLLHTSSDLHCDVGYASVLHHANCVSTTGTCGAAAAQFYCRTSCTQVLHATPRRR